MKSTGATAGTETLRVGLAPYDTGTWTCCIFVRGMPQLQPNAPPKIQTSLNLTPGPSRRMAWPMRSGEQSISHLPMECVFPETPLHAIADNGRVMNNTMPISPGIVVPRL
jgi:hypothetical protein